VSPRERKGKGSPREGVRSRGSREEGDCTESMSGAPPAKAAKLGRADTPLHLREDRGERQRKVRGARCCYSGQWRLTARVPSLVLLAVQRPRRRCPVPSRHRRVRAGEPPSLFSKASRAVALLTRLTATALLLCSERTWRERWRCSSEPSHRYSHVTPVRSSKVSADTRHRSLRVPLLPVLSGFRPPNPLLQRVAAPLRWRKPG